MQDKITIVVCNPGADAEETQIPNTLEAMQAAVGGYLEIIRTNGTPLACFDVFVNEDGNMKGLAYNRRMPPGHNICGPLVVSKSDADGKQVSLTPGEVALVIGAVNALPKLPMS
jgi:hypothetical protein